MGTAPRRVTLLATGEEFPFDYDAVSGKLRVCDLPALPPDPLCSVLKVEFSGPVERKPEPQLARWLF
ncbi:MAG: hypothetical protein IJT50_07875 [Lentisphaeria bacterium]|nr:hypothetical protein [Lentisphaeria bacterium]